MARATGHLTGVGRPFCAPRCCAPRAGTMACGRRGCSARRAGALFFSSRRRHTRYWRDWSSAVCSSDLTPMETRERYRDLGELLSKALKRPVRIEPVDDYVKLRKGLEDKRYDLASVHNQKYEVIAVTRGWTEYKARFLMKKDAVFKQPQEVRGKKMVMPDPDSITAWMVRATLRDLGIDPAKESLGTTRYQDGIPFMMENGFYEIGIT